MNESNAVELACEALKLAQAAGADSAEASVSIARRFHAEARERAISKLEGSTGKSLFMRIFREGRKSTLSTSDFSAEGMKRRDCGARSRRPRTSRSTSLPDYRRRSRRITSISPSSTIASPTERAATRLTTR